MQRLRAASAAAWKPLLLLLLRKNQAACGFFFFPAYCLLYMHTCIQCKHSILVYNVKNALWQTIHSHKHLELWRWNADDTNPVTYSLFSSVAKYLALQMHCWPCWWPCFAIPLIRSRVLPITQAFDPGHLFFCTSKSLSVRWKLAHKCQRNIMSPIDVSFLGNEQHNNVV